MKILSKIFSEFLSVIGQMVMFLVIVVAILIGVATSNENSIQPLLFDDKTKY